MCKIFAITDLSKVTVTPKLLDAIKVQVSKTDNQGFGYAVVGHNGELGGERSIRVPQFKAMAKGTEHLSRAEQLPIVKKTSNRFGSLSAAMKSPKTLVAHGRWSTNTVSLENTHPYYNGDVALIHNGVVTDATGEMKQALVTDNDTEILLRYWEAGEMEAIEKSVTGYYAMAILDVEGRLHVVRDNRAYLHLAWVRSINSYMIATTPDIIRGVCKAMKWKHEAIEAITENIYAVFDGNDILSHREITPKQFVASAEFNSKATAAIGYHNPRSDVGWANGEDDAPAYRESEYMKEIRALENLDDEAGEVEELDFSQHRRRG